MGLKRGERDAHPFFLAGSDAPHHNRLGIDLGSRARAAQEQITCQIPIRSDVQTSRVRQAPTFILEATGRGIHRSVPGDQLDEYDVSKTPSI